MALHVFNIVSRVVEIVWCLVNTHSGCHVVLCKKNPQSGGMWSSSITIFQSQFMMVEVMVTRATGGAPTLNLCIHVREPPIWGGIYLSSLNIFYPISS